MGTSATPKSQPNRLRHSRNRPRGGGAVRQVRTKGNGNLRRWLGRLLIAVSAFGGVAAVIVWMDPMAQIKQVANRPIAGVTVEGEFRYLSQQKLQQLLAERVRGSFLQLDMRELKETLEQNPWVDRVAVSRQWPDRLVVRVEEQKPIARWGRSAFMNMRGDIIDVGDNSPLAELPMLHGSERYAREVMQKYVQIARLLAPAELGLKEVHLDETLSWTLHLQNGLTIRVGRDQVFERMQRLLSVFPKELAARKNQIASIDLRYDNGFAIGWKESGLESLALADNRSSAQ